LERRLRGRGQDSDEEIARRLAKPETRLPAFGKYYDYCVVNEDVERAGNEAQAIVVHYVQSAGVVSGLNNFWLVWRERLMNVLTKAPESQFAYVVLAARRARQIMAGARSLVENPRTLSRRASRVKNSTAGISNTISPSPIPIDTDKDGKQAPEVVRASNPSLRRSSAPAL